MRRFTIRCARIIDGTGAPWFEADVGVENGIIRSVGQALRTTDGLDVDAHGAFLAPGFIDTHTHDDLALLRSPAHVSKVRQGVTTLVTGNCGFSLFPGSAPTRALKEHSGSLLGAVTDEEVFGDFDLYARALTRHGLGPNVAALVGHGPLRLNVLGYQNRAATEREILTMQALLSEQLRQGAAGLSLGLVYPPSAYAARAELEALAKTVAEHGALLTAHLRSYEGALVASAEEFIGLLQVSGATGLVSHLQAAGKPYWGSVGRVLTLLEDARQNGIDVSADMYPYTAGSSTVLQLLPPWALEGGTKALYERLQNPRQRRAVAEAVCSGREGVWEAKVGLIGWDNITLSAVINPRLKPYQGETFGRAAGRAGVEPVEFLFNVIEHDGGRSNIVMFQQSGDELQETLKHRLVMIGSDSIPRLEGLPHPRGCGTFPRMIRSALDAKATPLEEVVRHMTSLPAQRFRLWDRGTVRPGMRADLVLFSDQTADKATYAQPTLPPVGVADVWVGGVAVVRDEQPTYALPGTVLRCGAA